MSQHETPATPPGGQPGGHDERADAVAYQLLIPLLLIALLNGMHSPFTGLLVKFAAGWYPPFLPPMPELVFYFAQLLVSTLTLMLAGIPAALYERLAGNGRSTFVSMGLWLLGAALLTLPALGVMRQVLTSS